MVFSSKAGLFFFWFLSIVVLFEETDHNTDCTQNCIHVFNCLYFVLLGALTLFNAYIDYTDK